MIFYFFTYPSSDFLLLISLAPAIALVIDRILGEPNYKIHPVVLMGIWLDWAGKRLAPQIGQQVLSNERIFIMSALSWTSAAVAIFCGVYLFQEWIFSQPAWLAAIALGFFLKPFMAWAMLYDEVMKVESALNISLDAGRNQLSRLVSRDTKQLSEHQVRESAIESLSENLNDSLIAPLFWFALFGLAGAALFRFANTADAMWGYKGERGGRDWEYAGKWAAKADDVLAYIPARITALLILIVKPTNFFKNLSKLKTEAIKTPSPNSGWPMAAMAILLNVYLRKPDVYTLNESAQKSPQSSDTILALKISSRVALLYTLITCVLIGGILL